MSRDSIVKPSSGTGSLAIISDIHGNLEALTAVLDKMESLGTKRIVCLGDIVGYSPNPVECIDLLKDCEAIVTGDWDAAAISTDDPCWSPFLLEQLRWVRDEIAGDQSAQQIIKSGCLAILCVALTVGWHRMREQRRSRHLERDALAMTPSGDENLNGHWHARQEADNGDVSWGVRLEQHGMAVAGAMQCKFAGAYPLTIRGILEDGNLTATWSRTHKYCMGSGIIHLTLSDDGNTLTGTTQWYNAENPEGITDNWCWERSQIDNATESRQNHAANGSRR